MELGYYNGKKVFVTGHTGFKGSWLTVWLTQLGAQVKGFSLKREHSLIDSESICRHQIGDIRNLDLLKSSILDFQPDFIFHLAAQALVIDSYSNPLFTYETNVIGSIHVLEAMRSLNKKCTCVMVTTDKVYHNNEWELPYRETDRLGGFDPYSSSKACAEIAIDSYRNSFFNPSTYTQHQKTIVVVRAGNVIGGGDMSPNRIIPDLIRAINEHKPAILRNPTSVRPWQHVLEPIGAYMQLALKANSNHKLFNEAFNVGPNISDTLTVGELVNTFHSFWPSLKTTTPNNTTQKLHEAQLLRLDITKINESIGWKPKLSAPKAIELTASWYRRQIDGQNPIDITLEQIKYYQDEV